MFGQLYNFYGLWKNLHLPEKKLRQIQLEKLKLIIKYANDNVPYYKQLFNQIGLNANDIKSVEDISSIPVLTKKIIREAGDELISRKFKKENLIQQKTGGSSGEPMIFYRNKSSFSISRASKLRSFIANGYKLNWKIAEMHGFYLKSNSKYFHKFGVHQTVDIPADIDLHYQYELLKDLKPLCIDAFPNRLEEISNYILNNNLNELSPELIFTNSETLRESVRKLAIKAFGKNVVDIYGNTEFQFVAWQCNKTNGYHVNSDQVILQIDEKSKYNNSGEVIGTDLTNFAMPLIRYNTNDFAEFENEKCSCGISLPLLKNIKGRESNFLILPSGKRISGTQYIDSILLHHKEVNKFYAKQNKDKSIEIFLDSEKLCEEKEREIINKIRKECENIDVKITYEKNQQKTGRGKFIIFTSEIN